MGVEVIASPAGQARAKDLSLFERLTFCWMGPVASAARRGVLTVPDLFLPRENLSQNAYNEFNTNWEQEIASEKRGRSQPSLLRALRKTYFKDYFIAGLFKACWSVFVIAGAFFFVRR